jgi:hypothetical protein
MTTNNQDSNLELLNQQIWELRRSVESATAVISRLLIMILAVLILQNWQLIVGVSIWCLGVLILVVKASLPFTDFLYQKTGLSLMALLSLTVIVGFVTYFVINASAILLKEWWDQRQNAKTVDHKKMSEADSMRLKREAELEADMQNYFERKQAYLKEAEQFLTDQKQTK